MPRQMLRKVLLTFRLKRWARWATRRLSDAAQPGLVAEMRSLMQDVESGGVDVDGSPYIQWSDGKRFYGVPGNSFPAAARRSRWSRLLNDDQLGILTGIVYRYRYPHADATFCPPHPIAERKTWHPQHADTTADLRVVDDAVRQSLSSAFRIRENDVVLDVGAFMGFGAMRLSELVGPGGRVVSLEADSGNQEILRKNIDNNQIRNVTLVPRGAWTESTELNLQCDGRQVNSLVQGDPVEGRAKVGIKTISLDEVVSQEDLERVDIVSLTINGAEPEAVEGLRETLANFQPALTIAGWYMRDGTPVSELVRPQLESHGYHVVVGPAGRVYAWHPEATRNRIDKGAS